MERNAKCFFVSFQEIKENDFSPSISDYKEIEYDEVEYEPPQEIKKKILDLKEKIIVSLKDLEI